MKVVLHSRRRDVVLGPELLYIAAMFHDLCPTAEYGQKLASKSTAPFEQRFIGRRGQNRLVGNRSTRDFCG
jgi:hypothetical protein